MPDDTQPEYDPFYCRCKRCEKFWKDSFTEVSLISKPAIVRAADTSTMFAAVRNRENHPAVLKIGDRVIIKDTQKGTIRWVGIMNDTVAAPETYVGVKLDDCEGEHNGVYKGKRYFYCPNGHGTMARYCDIIRLNPPEVKPPLTGNEMYPSYEDVKARRKLRMEKDPTWSLTPKNPHERQGRARTSTDRNDMAALDLKRKERKHKREVAMAVQEKEAKSEQSQRDAHQHLKEVLGGDRRADRLAKTIRKLQLAYKEGLEYKRREDADDLSDYSDDEVFGKRENMDKSREKLKWKSSLKKRQKIERKGMYR